MMFPAAIPEVPVASVDRAATHYVDVFGFTLDWGDEVGGIAGVSRGACRIFLTNSSFRGHHGNMVPVLLWVNLQSKSEVDELFADWKHAHARIISPPEDKPWKLREFIAADLDGNLLRVFYDFRSGL